MICKYNDIQIKGKKLSMLLCETKACCLLSKLCVHVQMGATVSSTSFLCSRLSAGIAYRLHCN